MQNTILDLPDIKSWTMCEE